MVTRNVKITDAKCIGADEWWCKWYRCSKCRDTKITNSFNYCPNCGSKLIWDLKRGQNENINI